MQTLLSNIASRARQACLKASDFIEEEREFPVSQVFLNATFKRYVTDNVRLLKDLHADLHDGWLRLYATIDVAGIYANLSVDLKLVSMQMNKDVQLIVFEQISDTRVIEAKFAKAWLKLAVNTALFFYQKILKKDPLGKILSKYNIVYVENELLHLDLNRWLGKPAILNTLNKVRINHAVLAETELRVQGNISLMALFNRFDHAENNMDDELESTVTPIQQKNG